jgi:NAD(P)-dependent dehydrogenase (short-subunit alcohol dehydrogenase family)
LARSRTPAGDLNRREFLGGSALAAGAGLLAAAAGVQRAGAAEAPARAPASTPAPLKDVAGKVAFITGGSSGIGLGQARVFHEAGMKVVIGYIRDDQIEEALSHFTTDRDRVLAIKANVTDRAAMRAAADEIDAKFGGVHLLSNNAGIGLWTPVSEVDGGTFDQTMAVNVTGVYNGILEFLPRMRKRGQGGHVISTSSGAGLQGTSGATVYVASKFAVVGMMEGLRREMETANEPIGVSVFCPGAVNTNIYQISENLNASFDDAQLPAGVERDEARSKALVERGMDPLEAARIVLDGIRNNDLYILTHANLATVLHERHEAIEAAVPGAAPAAGAGGAASMYARERDKLRARKTRTP